MDWRSVFQVGAAGMELEKRRLDVAALNLANLHVSSAPGVASWRPLKVAAGALQVDFHGLLAAFGAATAVAPRELRTVEVELPPRLVHEPGHPHADERGMVRFAPVDASQEMIVAMTALRAYEANVAALGIARSMAVKALEIGGRG